MGLDDGITSSVEAPTMFALQSDHPHPAGAGLELTYACTDKVSRFFGPVCWLDVDCSVAADHPQRTGRTAGGQLHLRGEVLRWIFAGGGGGVGWRVGGRRG